MKRLAALLLIAAAAPAAWSADYLQAVEFPYYLYPRTLWERELVWLKNIGVQTVEFPIPANYHQLQPGEFDLTGSTSPRRDLVGFVRLLRKLGMRAWVRPLTPANGLINARLDAAQQRAWLKQLEQVLATQTASHGGPVEFVEGRVLAIDAAAPPSPVSTLSANDPIAFARSREAMSTARGALIWTDVEDALFPAGWAANPVTLLRKGAVGLSGDEHPATATLRRDAALLRGWSRLFADLRHVAMPKPVAGKLPEGVSAVQLVSASASAVSITNSSKKPFRDDVRVVEPLSKRTLLIPGVSVGAEQSLWLPVSVSLGPDGLCRECTNFASTEHIVYATSELHSIEFENGILAMEFAAPEAGEVILQMTRRPVGPFLAAGKPTDFDWDDAHMRARLTIPAGKSPGYRVRIGIAIEAPETSGFFNDLHRLVIGRANAVSTMYSSAEVAGRSRLRLPEGYTAKPAQKSPNEIDYEITVPAEAVHGDYANLTLEADGVALGRARVQLFRPASIRLLSGMQFHIGQETELTPEPAVAAIDPKAGGILEFSIRNNTSQIQTYHFEPKCEGLELLPAKADLSVGPTDERRIEFSAFAGDGVTGSRECMVKVAGGADVAMPVHVILVPRNATVAWTADLDGDGANEWILESSKVRAIFSGQDGGRWIEFTWKDTNTNFLPETGLFAQADAVEIRDAGGALEFSGKGWKRTARLSGTTLTVEQSTALPADSLLGEKRGSVTLRVERATPSRVVYHLD